MAIDTERCQQDDLDQAVYVNYPPPTVPDIV